MGEGVPKPKARAGIFHLHPPHFGVNDVFREEVYATIEVVVSVPLKDDYTKCRIPEEAANEIVCIIFESWAHTAVQSCHLEDVTFADSHRPNLAGLLRRLELQDNMSASVLAQPPSSSGSLTLGYAAAKRDNYMQVPS